MTKVSSLDPTNRTSDSGGILRRPSLDNQSGLGRGLLEKAIQTRYGFIGPQHLELGLECN